MTVYERLKIAAQVALQWDRKDYKFMTQAEAWEMDRSAYDDGILFLVPDNTDGVVATADPEDPKKVQIEMKNDGLMFLDTEDGNLKIYN